jgi:hypothetical protein
MTTGLPDPSARHLRRLVTARTLADRHGTSLESVDLEEAAADGPAT